MSSASTTKIKEQIHVWKYFEKIKINQPLGSSLTMREPNLDSLWKSMILAQPNVQLKTWKQFKNECKKKSIETIPNKEKRQFTVQNVKLSEESTDKKTQRRKKVITL